MINVGVCDDELYYREKIKKLVEYNFNNMGDVEVNTVLYSSGEELCKDQQFLKKCEILCYCPNSKSIIICVLATTLLNS